MDATKKNAVLWDLDGTLVDSEEYHWRAWQQTMRTEGIEISREQFLATFGRRNDSFVPGWLGPGASPDRVRRVGDEKEVCYRRLVKEGGISALPGAAEWVKRLHEAGWLQAVASSAPRMNLETILHALRLERVFEATVAAEDVTHGKPEPEVFLKAAARLGVVPGRCIVVEDVAAGIEAAKRAGMRTVGVSRGAAPLDADVAAASLADLPPDTFERLLPKA